MSDRKKIHDAEKAAIKAVQDGGSRLINNPPNECYCVATEVPLVAYEVPHPEEYDLNEFGFNTNIHIESAAKLDKRHLDSLVLGVDGDGSMVTFIEGIEGTVREGHLYTWTPTVILDYPMNGAAFAIPIELGFAEGLASVGDVVYAIAQAYRAAYMNPEKHGIWGHAMGDLVIEGIDIDRDRSIIRPSVGS